MQHHQDIGQHTGDAVGGKVRGEAMESCKNTSEVDLVVELELTRVTRARGTVARGECGQHCAMNSAPWPVRSSVWLEVGRDWEGSEGHITRNVVRAAIKLIVHRGTLVRVKDCAKSYWNLF